MEATQAADAAAKEEELDAAPPAQASTSGRPCEVCQAQASKYCCPGCAVRTCSLACTKSHKQNSGCTGKRDRLAFVPLAKFSDKELVSDYAFLEEVARADDVAKRVLPPFPAAQLPAHLAALVAAARRRGVTLRLMAPGMQRRKSNSTKYDKRSDALLWKVEWQFPGAGTIRVDPRVDESAPLEAVLQAHLRYKRGAAAKTFALRDYAEAGPAALRVLLRKEGSPANQPSYYAVDLGSCLRQQLAGAVVVENPVLIVALPGAEAEGYRVVPREPQQQGAGAGHGWAGHGQQQRQQQQYPGPPPRPAPQGGAQSRFATEAAGLQIAPPASSAPGPIQQEQQPSVTQEGQEQQQQQRTAAWAGHAQQQAAPVVGADLGATGVGAASEELATKRARMK